jgi:stage V sporulation protein B
MYLDTAVDSVLKGLGQQVYTMKVNIIDAFVSVLAVWLLVPHLGLKGYIVVIFISELINFSFSFTRMVTVAGAKGIFFRRIPLPVLAAMGGVGLAKQIVRFLPASAAPAMGAAMGMALAAMGYVTLLLLFGVIPQRRVLSLVRSLRLSLPRRTVPRHESSNV